MHWSSKNRKSLKNRKSMLFKLNASFNLVNEIKTLKEAPIYEITGEKVTKSKYKHAETNCCL